jgi:para-nitrobenzyl esterase
MTRVKSFLALAAAASALALGAIHSGSPALTTVRVAGGELAGVASQDGSVASFKGVPFAAPPVGDRRWRAPEPAASWQGVRKADAFSANCMQNIVDARKPWTYEFMAHGAIGEDCLYLNVWTPAKAATERHPVLVYIHGGGNTEGSGSVPVYDGSGLAAKGLVVVTINYRLGVFGFFGHPELTQEAPYHASGNYALLDQIAAVKWVKANAAAFGGDPARITVAGQSAGAFGVRNLLISPLAAGSFQRAIAESGVSLGGFGGSRALADLEQDGVRFARAKNVASVAELRALTAQQIATPPVGGAPYRWGTVIDNYALVAGEADAFAAGKHNDVPVLTGTNRDESGAVPQPTTTAAAFQKQLEQRYADRAGDVLKLYPAATDDEAKTTQNASARDIARVTTSIWVAARAKTAKSNTFTYFWDHTLPGPDAAQYGAFHTSEVPYVMNTLAFSDRPFTADDTRIADMMSSYWANFAAAGDPNGKGLPHWPSFAEKPDQTMNVGDAFAPIPLAGSADKLRLLQAILAPKPKS